MLTSHQCDLLLDIREQAFVCNHAYEQLATHREEEHPDKKWRKTHDLLSKELLASTTTLAEMIREANAIHLIERATYVIVRYLTPELHEHIMETASG